MAGTAGLPGAATRPGGPVRPGRSRTGRSPMMRTATSSAGSDGQATGLCLAAGAPRAHQTRVAMLPTGALPVAASGPIGLVARQDQAASDPTTGVAHPRPGRTRAGPAPRRTAIRAAGQQAGTSRAVMTTGAGFLRATSSRVRHGLLVRCTGAPGQLSRRHGERYRKCGLRTGGRVRPGPRSPVGFRRPTRGQTPARARPARTVAEMPPCGATPNGARRPAPGRMGRQHQRTAPGRAPITGQAGGPKPAPGRRGPTARCGPASPPTARFLWRPTGTCPPRQPAAYLRQPTGLVPRTGSGRSSVNCAPSQRRGRSRCGLSQHRLRQHRLRQHRHRSLRRRSPRLASGLRASRSPISTGCARRWNCCPMSRRVRLARRPRQKTAPFPPLSLPTLRARSERAVATTRQTRPRCQ